jgi:FkbM family methyltransferase
MATVPTDSKEVRLRRFLRRPWREKRRSLLLKWARTFPALPIPVRVPYGSWWFVHDDVFGMAILSGGFENAEVCFVERYLKPGMTVLDIGAHHGFYSLLASSKVGSKGQVFAFEPSPRERERLSKHLRFNYCRNVQVEPTALGEAEGHADLFLVEGYESGCNSLRPPAVDEETRQLRVPVIRLESFLQRERLESVDFVKLDVEGAELGVLRGCGSLLDRFPRPVILAEVQDIRTLPWGYRAIEIARLLHKDGFFLFQPIENGDIVPFDLSSGEIDGSLIAVPRERMGSLQSFVAPDHHLGDHTEESGFLADSQNAPRINRHSSKTADRLVSTETNSVGGFAANSR